MAKKKSTTKRVLKAIGKYQRRKISYICRLKAETASLTIDVNKATLPLGDILSSNNSEYLELGSQYGQVKLRGIGIRVVPCQNTAQGDPTVCLALLQANDEVTFNNIRTQPHVMTLSPEVASSIYIPYSGAFNATNATSDIGNIKIAPAIVGSITSGLLMWQVKISLYLTFKSVL